MDEAAPGQRLEHNWEAHAEEAFFVVPSPLSSALNRHRQSPCSSSEDMRNESTWLEQRCFGEVHATYLTVS